LQGRQRLQPLQITSLLAYHTEDPDE